MTHLRPISFVGIPSSTVSAEASKPSPDQLSVVIETPAPNDSALWDATVAAGSGNPVQFSDYGKVYFRHRQPLFVTVRDQAGCRLCWLVHYVGVPLLGYIDIMAEPSHHDPTALKAALNALERRYRPARFSFHNVTLSRFQDAETLAALGWATETKYGTYEVDLQIDEEALWNQVNAKHRNRIRRAQDDHVHVIEKNDMAAIDEFLTLLARTLADSSVKPPSREHLESCFAALGPRDGCRAFFSQKDSQTQAATVILGSKQRAICWLAATIDRPAPGAAALMQWRVMLALRQQGVARYDFGGVALVPLPDSPAAGIASFKERFGGRLVSCVGASRVVSRWRDSLLRHAGIVTD
jgi:CelD/BcsL family acetyltransferase involved in cellulose biosynthesis